MNKLILIFIIIIPVSLINCSEDNNNDNEDLAYDCATMEYFSDTTIRSTEPTLKGHILFSWENNNDVWNYSVAPNLNVRPANEMVCSGNTVSGIECLKKNLNYFPVGENIFWFGSGEIENADGDLLILSFPPAEIINELKQYCQQINIELTQEN